MGLGMFAGVPKRRFLQTPQLKGSGVLCQSALVDPTARLVLTLQPAVEIHWRLEDGWKLGGHG